MSACIDVTSRCTATMSACINVTSRCIDVMFSTWNMAHHLWHKSRVSNEMSRCVNISIRCPDVMSRCISVTSRCIDMTSRCSKVAFQGNFFGRAFDLISVKSTIYTCAVKYVCTPKLYSMGLNCRLDFHPEEKEWRCSHKQNNMRYSDGVISM